MIFNFLQMINSLTLTLFETWIFLVDDVQFSLAAHDLTIYTTLFNGCPDLHTNIFFFLRWPFNLLVSEYNPASGKIIRTHFHPHLISR